ncbi:DUF4271 domain-containing protein [Aurantibacter crassamenti]|uniref:DUF4271 domain-containing protein n=1 Tax=Aurantibacter crassamenti TaxID=1837375 RepID=UPI00193AD7B5|nr:DUF4271 domain-containing protein [Aurantibacter crassamenti]MBM1104797.1 DUF4271 domain-containing protein [Aurantibacter crassamenti]
MEPILRATQDFDWITLLIFCSILFLVIAKSLFYSRFLNFIILPFNNKYIFMYNKKDKLLNWFHVFFSIFQIVNFSVFIYFAITILNEQAQSSSPFIYPIIITSLFIFLIVKVITQMGSGFIFGSTKVISELIFKKLSYLNYSGIIMLFANVILAYILQNSEVVVYITILLVLIINAIGWATTLRSHQKYLANNFFYFILYLCALEIAPLVIIGSYLKY